MQVNEKIPQIVQFAVYIDDWLVESNFMYYPSSEAMMYQEEKEKIQFFYGVGIYTPHTLRPSYRQSL